MLNQRGEGRMGYMLWASARTVLLWSGVAFAEADYYCRPIEYAELKDMTAEDLQRTYCRDQKIHGALDGAVNKLAALHADLSTLDDHINRRNRCSDELDKMRTALKARALLNSVRCEASTSSK